MSIIWRFLVNWGDFIAIPLAITSIIISIKYTPESEEE